MKIKTLTLVLALVLPFIGMAQTFTGGGGAVGPNAGDYLFPVTVSGVAGNTIPGGTCASTGLQIADLEAPAVIGYNTEITNITITNVQHTFASDLEIFLISPDGIEFTLSLDNGGTTGTDVATDIVFDLMATDCIDSWTGSTSTVQPANGVLPETVENTCGPLTAEFTWVCGINSGQLFGAAVEGEWTLNMADDAGGDGGTFTDFSITFAPMAAIPTEDSFGTPIDLLACCVDVCELEGTTEYNVALEAGECEEVMFFDAPTLGGGPSCVFCAESQLPTGAVAFMDAGTSADEVFDADGNIESVTLNAGTNADITYELTLAEDGALGFDYSFNGDAFWDDFVIDGPAGNIVTNGAATGSICEPGVAGDVFSIELAGGPFTPSPTMDITNISFAASGAYPCYLLEQVSGPENGSYAGPGAYTVEWVATPQTANGCDVMGDPDNALTFTQTITVLEYDGPVSTALACNDHVNISADADCNIEIGADMFLEGGPYACYGDYMVNIWPFNNPNLATGDVNGLVIDFSELIGDHTYEVIDPLTGNTCWGTFTVEDKLAPVLEPADDLTVTCVDIIPESVNFVDLSMVTIVENTNTTADQSFSVNIPNGFTITDLNVVVMVESTSGNQTANHAAEIVAPDGTVMELWPLGVNGCGAILNYVADQQGADDLLCTTYTEGLNANPQPIFDLVGGGNTPLDAVNGTNSAGTWTLNITGSADIVKYVLQFNNGEGLVEAVTPDIAGCGDASLTYSDSSVDNGCEGTVITRTWVATDASGNVSNTVDQIITVRNVGADELALPPALVELPCGSGTSPADIVAFYDNPLTKDRPLSATCLLDVVENNEGYPFGYPTYMQLGCDGNMHPQKVDNNVCSLYATYTDQEIAACGVGCNGNVKVIRSWTILDWCANTTTPYTQLIKAVDDEGPTFQVKDLTVSTDPWGCEANIDLDTPWELHDACDYNPTWTVSGPAGVQIVGNAVDGYTAIGVAKGDNVFTYTASDCCGNTTSIDATYTVVDGAPPVAIAKQNVVISLTSSASNTDGIAKIYAASIDNGSYDGCTDIKLEIRRKEDVCDVRGNTTFDATGHSDDGSSNPNSSSYDPDGGAYVKFCCEDISTATVDVDGDGELDAGYVEVVLRVWDDADMDGIAGTPAPFGADNLNETWAYVKVENKLPPVISCPADVTLTCDMDYTDLSMTGEATANGSCGGASVIYSDRVRVNSCNVGEVKRRWEVEGAPGIFCEQTITLEALQGPDPVVSFSAVGDFTAAGCPDNISVGEPTWTGGPCDVIGYTVSTDTFEFEDGACYKLINHYTVINWCVYEPNSPFWVETPDFTDGYVEHTQVIKVTDETVPVIENCEPQMYGVYEGCAANITLTNVATDEGSENCPTAWLKWQVFVDLWGDGTDDLEYSSFLPVFDGNLGNDTNGNGIGDKYLMPTSNGGEVQIELPTIAGSMSNHKVTWKVTDGCNNVRSCSSTFMVVDKKAPTPYCVSLSSAVMPSSGTVELWAIDFNVGSFDNCTEQDQLRYTFTDVAPEDDPAYLEDLRSSAKTFTDADVANSPVLVNMYVWDEKGNSDFCEVYLTLVNNGPTTGTGRSVAGTVSTSAGVAVPTVATTIDAVLPEYPRTAMTDAQGAYAFADNLENNSYEVTASYDGNLLEGVNTLDLVKIQRHILGLETLDNAYQVIAADINNDEQVKASDLLALRKAILGVSSEFPNNESWRFVDGAQTFADVQSPFPANEVLSVAMLESDMMNEDFVAVKVGDVDNTIDGLLADSGLSTRSDNALTLVTEDKEVVAGETVSVSFTSSELAEVFGYQFTMELNGLNFAGVDAGALAMNEDHVGVHNSMLTVSYNEVNAMTAGTSEELFTMNFVATTNGTLSEMIRTTSTVTSAEAYVGQSLETVGVEIAMRNGTTSVAAEYALLQNEPNPFKDQTTIGFTLPTAGQAVVTVLDVTGKVVTSKKVDGVSGYNQVVLTKEDISTSGVLYYQLESGDFTATKKMIIIE